MFFYLLLTLIFTLSIYFAEHNYITQFFHVPKKKAIRYSLIITCLLSILVVSLRNYKMADDTYMYYQFFNGPYIEFAEFGFYALAKIIGLFTSNFNIFLLCCSILSIVPFYFLVSKMKNQKWIYIFLYHVFLLYIYNFAIIRQTIAMSFVFLSFYFINKNNKKDMCLSILFFLLAISFHRISIIFIPLFFIDLIIANKSVTLSILILSIFLIIFKDDFLTFIFSYVFPDKSIYLSVSNDLSNFGIIPFLVFSFSEIIVFIMNKTDSSFFRKANYYFIYLTIFFFWFPAYGRILQFGYFNIVFLLGNIYNSHIIHNEKLKYIFICICVVFYVFLLFRNPYHVIPYFM